ncbi:hypothetical protein N9A89_06645, partial [Akkermansiaceae bacterium]|nr:hypothetical protein [Akkermansiaceae bacterium]
MAHELSRAGYRVIEIGYEGANRPSRERLSLSVQIFRLTLRSRSFRITPLRKVLATIEFLVKSRRLINRLRPSLLITFNDPASILMGTGLRGIPVKTTWLLEYPELELVSLPTRLILKLSAACWSKADVFVAPTKERLALHLGLKPKCRELRNFVVQNAPLLDSGRAAATPCLSASSREAIEALKEAGRKGFFRIVYSGAIGNRYAIDKLIEATGRSERGFLLLLGKKHELAEREVQEALKNCPDPTRIRWIDEIPYLEMQEVLPAADLGFSFYLGDTLNTRFSAPGKVYEYLKAGLLVLTDTQSCIHEMLNAYE